MFFNIFLVVLTFACAGSPTVKDIRAIFAEGKITDSEYTNGYFGLTLRRGNGRFAQGGFVSSAGTRARLTDLKADSSKRDDKYEIAVLADLLTANPSLHSPEQHVRSVRHEMEREGLETVQAESPTTVSGLTFVEAVMRANDGNGHSHYRSVCSAFLNRYALSLDASAASPERVEKVVEDSVKFKSTPNSDGAK